tara:strand:- start:146 stop:370 length:225 start_codon:yes stop_codon:yes gene_type:complete
MDKLNMINYQRLVLQEKFGKRKYEKKTIRNILKILLSMFLIGVFFSLLFLNTESQVLTQQFFPGFLNIGDLSHG